MKKEKPEKIEKKEPNPRGLALTLRVPPNGRVNIPAPVCEAEAIHGGQILHMEIRKWVDKGLSAPARAAVRMRKDGTFLTPKHIRDFLKIKPGDYLEVTILRRWGDKALIQETSHDLIPFKATVKDAFVTGKDIEDRVGGRENEQAEGCHE